MKKCENCDVEIKEADEGYACYDDIWLCEGCQPSDEDVQ